MLIRISIYVAILLALFFSLKGCFLFNKKFILKNSNSDLSEKLKNHVKYLSETIGIRDLNYKENLDKSAKYIKEQFETLGYEIKIQGYEVNSEKVENIIAIKHAKNNSPENILIGAHYDSCNNPGADDNASGVAALIELAAGLKSIECKKNIYFVAFVNEEPPYFKSEEMGSFVFAKEAKQQGQKFDAIIILEMLGFYSDEDNSQKYPPFIGFMYPAKANFIAFVSNFKSAFITGKAIKEFRKTTNFPAQMLAVPAKLPGVDFSDQWSFWQNDYKAFMVTDTSFYRNPNYHQDTDTYKTINYPYFAEVVKGLKEVIVKFAG